MKKRFLCLLLALLLLFTLCACARNNKGSVLRIYYPSVVSDDLVAQSIASQDYYGPANIESLMSALLYDLFGNDVSLVKWDQTGSLLRLTLSPEYGQRSGIDRTLTDCSITLTLCQLDSVSWVQINAPGSDNPYSTILSPKDMIFTGAEEEPREISVVLYFPRSSGRGLGFESRTLTLTEDDDLYANVTAALLAGPEGLGLRSPFPEELEVLGSKLEGGVCHVNFSSHLLDVEAPPAEQDLLLYSIVDTLGNMDSVSSVQILVEGEPLLHYGNTDTSIPLEPDFGLVAD